MMAFPGWSSWKLCLAFLAFLLVWDGPLQAEATQAYPYTDDKSVLTTVGQFPFSGLTYDQLQFFLSNNNARLTVLRVEDPTVPRFAGAAVANDREYSLGMATPYYNYAAADIPAVVNGNRLLSIDPYPTAAGTRFALVVTGNQGTYNRGFVWFAGRSSTDIAAMLSQYKARLQSLRPYVENGQTVFCGFMIGNQGTDFVTNSGGYWYTGQSTTDISNLRSQGWRLISLAVNPSGGYATVYIPSEGEQHDVYYSLTSTSLTQVTGSDYRRYIDIDPYFDSGTSTWKYVGLLLDNGNHRQDAINALSQTVDTHANGVGNWIGGYHGSYFIEAVPQASALVAVNSYYRFEPAGAIQVLYLIWLLQNGVNLDGSITYYWTSAGTPTPTVCPLDVPETAANARTTTIRTAIQGSLAGNNVYTRALALYVTLSRAQSLAANLGMSSTYLRQTHIGCAFRNGLRTETTLGDMARMYSSVEQSGVISGNARAQFYIFLPGLPVSPSSALGQVIADEASKQGKSAQVSNFLGMTGYKYLTGSYAIPMATDNSVHKRDMHTSGRLLLPFKPNARAFLFADFVSDLMIPCGTAGTCSQLASAVAEVDANVAEMARPQISAALAGF